MCMIDNPQVYGIAMVFEGKYLTQIYRFDTRGAKEYLKVLAAELQFNHTWRLIIYSKVISSKVV